MCIFVKIHEIEIGSRDLCSSRICGTRNRSTSACKEWTIHYSSVTMIRQAWSVNKDRTRWVSPFRSCLIFLAPKPSKSRSLSKEDVSQCKGIIKKI